jgi:hypothetical protein
MREAEDVDKEDVDIEYPLKSGEFDGNLHFVSETLCVRGLNSDQRWPIIGRFSFICVNLVLTGLYLAKYLLNSAGKKDAPLFPLLQRYLFRATSVYLSLNLIST